MGRLKDWTDQQIEKLKGAFRTRLEPEPESDWDRSNYFGHDLPGWYDTPEIKTVEKGEWISHDGVLETRTHIGKSDKGSHYGTEHSSGGGEPYGFEWGGTYRTETGALFAAAYGVNIDGTPIVDAQSEWTSKSPNEAVRECIGHIGVDSRTWDDFPGIQVQKDGVDGPIQWGKKCPTAQDADIESRMMRDRYLGYEPPDMRAPSDSEVKKAEAQSEQLGAKVHTQSYKQYAREYAREHLQHGRSGTAEKYGSQGLSKPCVQEDKLKL